MYSVDGGAKQSNSMAQSEQLLRQQERANNNAVADAYHQQVKQQQTADYVKGAGDVFKNAKTADGFRSALSSNSAKYMKPDASGTGKLISKGLGIEAETAEKASKIGGQVAGVVSAGTDLYEDIKAGHVAGANWAKQGQNIGDIVGAGLTGLAELDPELAPLALIGAGVELGADALGDIGDTLSSDKAGEDATKEMSSGLQAPASASTIAQSGGFVSER